MSRSRIPGSELALPTSTESSSHCLRPKNTAWGWVFPSAIRSSSITAVGFGHRRAFLEVQSFNLNCRLPMFTAMSVPGQKATLQGDRRMSALPLETDIYSRDEHV